MVREAASLRSKETKAKIEEYLINHPGATLKEIGDFLNVSRQWAHVLLRRMNIDLAAQRLYRQKILTGHQLEILRYVERGYKAKQIAEVMGCSAKAIRNQLHTIYTKLNAHKKNHAVQLATEQGLIQRNE